MTASPPMPDKARRARWRWWLALPVLVPVLLLLVLLTTDLGLKLAVFLALREVPLVTVSQTGGSLFNGFTLQGIRYVTKDQEIAIGSITVKLSPTCLLRRRICLETLAFHDIDWHILRKDKSPPFDFPAVVLPPQRVPVGIEIADAHFDRMTIHSRNEQDEARHFDIRNAKLQLHTDGDTVFLKDVRTELVFSGLTLSANLTGDVDIRGHTSANLNTSVKLDFRTDVPDLMIEGEVRGSLFTPEISVTTRGLVEAQTEIKASLRKKGWPIHARVKQNEPIQLTETVPVSLSNTLAIITGYVNAYHVEGTTEVSGIPRTPRVMAGIVTDGNFFGLTNGAVNLQIGEQLADVSGDFRWYPQLRWTTAVEFSHLNAGTWLEDITSDLSGSAVVEGTWHPKDVPFRNRVQALTASGKWLGQDAHMQTTFATSANHIDLEQLDLMLGRNRVSAQGSMKDHWQLDGELELPALADIVPQLQGAAHAKLALHGVRDNPAISLEATSKELQLGTTRLDNVTMNLAGTLAQHVFSGAAEWKGYTAKTILAGGLDQSRWEGWVKTLDITGSEHAAPEGKGKPKSKRFTLVNPVPAKVDIERQQWQITNACLHHIEERICASVDWDVKTGKGELMAALADFQPDILLPLTDAIDAAPGRWSGEINAQLANNQPTRAAWQLTVDALSLRRLQDKRFTPTLALTQARIDGEFRHGRLASEGTLTWPDQASTRFKLRLPNIRTPHTLDVMLETAPLPLTWAAPWIPGATIQAGTLAGHVEGSLDAGWPTLTGNLEIQAGRLSNPGHTLGLEQLNLQLAMHGTRAVLTGTTQDDRGMTWQIETPVAAQWSGPERTVQLQQGCVGTGSTSLCAEGDFSPVQGLRLEANAQGNISPWLAPVLTDNTLIDGPFEAHARLGGHAGAFSGDLTLHSRVTSTVPPDDGTPAPAADIALQSTLADDTLRTQLKISGQEAAHIDAQLSAQVSDDRRLDGFVNVRHVQIAPLRTVIREAEKLAGELNGTFLISGQLNQPRIEGTLKLSKGRFSSADYPISFSQINAEALFTQQNAQLIAHLESGKRGRATLSSSARWDTGELLTESRFIGSQLPVKQGSDINLRLDTDLTLASSEGRIDLGGLIHVQEGFLRVAKLPENSVNISRDAVFVDQRGAMVSERGLETHLNLVLRLSDLVQLDGLGAQVRMSGAVGIQQTPPLDPVGRGSLTITEGTYTGYGQKLKIAKGQILFNGPLESPVLAIKAVREITNGGGSAVTAGINISGSPQQPESSLFSVPAMPEEDILSYIVLGRARSASGSASNFAMNQALLSVGLYGSEDFTRDLASKVGIDDFEISTSTDSENNDSVNVGGYLSPRLFLQYGVGIKSPVRTITLRYRLTERIFLEALSGLESALDVLYSFEVE